MTAIAVINDMMGSENKTREKDDGAHVAVVLLPQPLGRW